MDDNTILQKIVQGVDEEEEDLDYSENEEGEEGEIMDQCEGKDEKKCNETEGGEKSNDSQEKEEHEEEEYPTNNFGWINVKYSKRMVSAKIPTKGSSGSAGYDLYSAEEIYLPPHSQNTKIKTGVSMALPPGVCGLIMSRSGLACVHGIGVISTGGVVDSDFRGPIAVHIENNSPNGRTIRVHERIAQILFVPYFDVIFEYSQNLNTTSRGTGGFGSTGK